MRSRAKASMSEPRSDGTPGCAICGKPQEAKYRPFCSKRCADIDLGRWLNEGYRIPGGPVADEDEPDKSQRSR
jgi:endogenous inhibitor of DNA gyrase (YacG/DUF329 family)